MRKIAFAALLCLLLAGWIHGGGGTVTPYQGPCDQVQCAEAFSVTRAMVLGYSGPLFQLYNGSSTLDIGQTASHTADMTTWSAFCGGVQANCVYGKIYGQISGNVLVPATTNLHTNCAGGTNYKCAAPFMIEVATGLPIIETTTGQEYYNGTLGSDDTASTGINSGSNPISVVFNGINIQSTFCCGMFGMTHKYNAGDTTGTDFSVTLGYGSDTEGDPGVCGTSTTFCLDIDEEGAGDTADYGSSVINVVAAITFDSSANRVTGTLNNHSLFSNSPPASTLKPGNFIHFGGGGDLSQPAPSDMREGIMTNSTLSSGQIDAIYQNMTAFYSGLTFP